MSQKFGNGGNNGRGSNSGGPSRTEQRQGTKAPQPKPKHN